MQTESAMDRYVSIALSGGRAGLVLNECHCVALSKRSLSDLPRADAWRELLESLVSDPSCLDRHRQWKYSEAGEVFSVRWTFDAGQLDLLVKVSRRRGFLERVSRLARPSRSRRNFNHARQLMADGISTAPPLAIVEDKSEADWFVSAFIEGLVDLDQIALTLLPRVDTRSVRRVKDRLIERVASLLVLLQGTGWLHRDLKASNIMFTDWDREEARIWLVDLDGLSRGSKRTSLDLAPVVRLAASLFHLQTVSTTDAARFIRRLLRAFDADDGSWRETLRTVVSRAAVYNRRARRRKTAKLDGFDAG